MNRALRRAAPIALASAAALILAGCAGSGTPPEPTETAAAAECMDVASGSLSDGVTVEGEFAASPAATFETPVEASELERTVAIEGDGDETVAGDTVNVIVTLYSGTSGDEVVAAQSGQLKAGDESLPEALRASIDCVPAGSRTVTVAPAETLFGETGNESIGIAPGEPVVIVIDVVEIQEPLTPSEWTEDVPEVEFGAEGEAPTVTIPDTEPPTELQLKVLEEGDGDTIEAGDTVTLDYQGLSWDSGEVFEQSFGTGQPLTVTTEGVIPGFGAALIGQKAGTKLIVSIPPEYAYGTDPAAHDLGGQTLVFLLDILETAPPAQ